MKYVTSNLPYIKITYYVVLLEADGMRKHKMSLIGLVSGTVNHNISVEHQLKYEHVKFKTLTYQWLHFGLNLFIYDTIRYLGKGIENK